MTETETVSSAQATPEIVARVSNIPLVASTIQQLTVIYNTTKDSNQYVKYTLETAEGGVKTVTDKAVKPLVEKLDGMACEGLNKLEDKYPIITKPTEEVYEATLKPTVDKVTAAKDYSVDKVNAAKSYGIETVQGVSSYTTGKVDDVKQASLQTVSTVTTYGNEKLQGALQTPVGQKVVSQVDRFLDLTDSYLDYYLPEDESESSECNGEKADGAKASGMGHAVAITEKARRRMYSRAMSDLNAVKLRTKETIDKLNFTVDLIQYAKDNVDNVQGKMSGIPTKLKSVWDEINMSEEEAAEGTTKTDDDATTTDITSATFEKRAIATARHITLKLKRGVSTITPTAALLPASLKDRVEEVRKYTEQLYTTLTSAGSFKDLPNRVLDQTKEKASSMQDTLNEIYKYIQNNIVTSWLIQVKCGDCTLTTQGAISIEMNTSNLTTEISDEVLSPNRTVTWNDADTPGALLLPDMHSSSSSSSRAMPQWTHSLKSPSENVNGAESTEGTRDKTEEKKDN